MKRIIFTQFFIVFFIAGMWAQLKVNNYGNVGIGVDPASTYKVVIKGRVNGDLYGGISDWNNGLTIRDPHVPGNSINFQVYSPFDDYHFASISPGSATNFGCLFGWYGADIEYLSCYSGYFNELTCNSLINYSSNTRTLQSAKAASLDLSAFYQLNPITYQSIDSINVTTKMGTLKTMKFDKGSSAKLGFVAEEVQSLYPDLVSVDENTGLVGVKTLEFIPLLVKVVQNQQQEINALKAVLSNASGTKKVAAKNSSEEELFSTEEPQTAALYQNTPNPFSQATEIGYYLPGSVRTAALCIYDMQGKQLKQIVINKHGNGTEVISGSAFAAGIYLYALLADGKEVDVKRMILTE